MICLHPYLVVSLSVKKALRQAELSSKMQRFENEQAGKIAFIGT